MFSVNLNRVELRGFKFSRVYFLHMRREFATGDWLDALFYCRSFGMGAIRRNDINSQLM